MKKLRVGIVGTGFGARVHAPGFMLHPECEVVALSGVSRPGRAQEHATRLGIPHAYDDYQRMLANEELDLIAIASAPHQHCPMTMAALERGIAVLCEKPMALNVGEAKAMAAAAEERGLVNAINFEFRHHPARTLFRQRVAEGFLGDLVHVNFCYVRPGFEQNVNRPAGWLWRTETGGGMLGALGSHMIDTLRWCFGEIEDVSGLLTTQMEVRSGEPVDADDTFAFLLRFGGKATGVVQFLTHAHHGFGVRLEAYGTKGSLVMLDDKRLLAGRAGESLAEVPIPAHFEIPGVTFPAQYESYIPAFAVMVDNLVQAVRGRNEPGPSRSYATFRDGVAVQAVLDAVRRSHTEGCWVSLS